MYIIIDKYYRSTQGYTKRNVFASISTIKNQNYLYFFLRKLFLKLFPEQNFGGIPYNAHGAQIP